MTEQLIEIFETTDGQTQIEVRFERETIWLSQAQMAELFDKDSDTIGLHLKNIFKTKELEESTTTEESSVVRQEGKRQVSRTIKFYNLDAIISVGYRVNSKKGTQFRIWATRRLREYLVQGYSIDRRRFKQNAADLFVDVLHRNRRLMNTQVQPCINNAGLAALTLLVAESRPDQKETIIHLNMNMLAKVEWQP